MSTAPPPAFRPRQRVRYVGISGAADGPSGRVWRVTKSGVWVTLADGSRTCWHPDDVRPAAEPQVSTTIR